MEIGIEMEMEMEMEVDIAMEIRQRDGRHGLAMRTAGKMTPHSWLLWFQPVRRSGGNGMVMVMVMVMVIVWRWPFARDGDGNVGSFHY